MIIKQEVGLRLSELRKMKNLSMMEVASYVGVSGRSTINGWEKGRSVPKKEFLEKLSSLFDVPENFILYGSMENYIINLLIYCSKNAHKYSKLIKNINEYFKFSEGINGHNSYEDNNIMNLDKKMIASAVYFSETTYDKLKEETEPYKDLIITVGKIILVQNIDMANTEEVIEIINTTVEKFVNTKKHTFTGQQILLIKYIEENMDSSNYLFAWPYGDIDDYIELRNAQGSSNIEKDIDDYYKLKLSYQVFNESKKIIRDLTISYNESMKKFNQ